MVRLGRPYYFKFFKGCLPQIFLGPFLNTLTHIYLNKPAAENYWFFKVCMTFQWTPGAKGMEDTMFGAMKCAKIRKVVIHLMEALIPRCKQHSSISKIRTANNVICVISLQADKYL